MAEYRHAVKTNCTFCGAPFESINLSKVCTYCDENMEEYFRQIGDFFKQNPQTTDEEISYSLNLPIKIVAFYFKKSKTGRVPQNNKQPLVRCSKCNTLIISGSICVQCDLLSSQQDTSDSYIRTIPTGKPAVSVSTRKN